MSNVEREPKRSLPLAPAADTTRKAPRSMPIFRHYQPRVGHPDWPTLFARAEAKAARLLPTLAPPRTPLADLPRRARSIATAAGSFVENARRARAGREDLLPLYFIWTTHNGCNFLCDYCDDHRGRRYPELSREGALDTRDGVRLLEVMRTRASSVYFAGGEPTMRKDLPELVRAARDLAYYPIIVNTNASAIGAQLELPAWRSWLADVDTIIVSLDGLELDWLARTWGYARPADVIENLLLLRALAAPMGVRLAVNAVIQPGAVEHARDVLDLACDLGLWFSPVPCNEGPGVAGGLHDDPAYRALAERILARKAEGYRVQGSQRMNRRLLGSAQLSCRNTLKPHVDHDGRLFWPCKAASAVEPLRVRVLDYADVDALWADCTRKLDPTGFAARCGSHCNWAQNYSTDAYAYGLEHPWSLAAEVRDFLRVS